MSAKKKSKSQKNQNQKRRRIKIAFEAPQAKEVILMGDFNKWNAKIHPMKMNQEGTWEKILMLYPGRYEYKFLQDGQWQLDSKNRETCDNRFGSQNSVLIV